MSMTLTDVLFSPVVVSGIIGAFVTFAGLGLTFVSKRSSDGNTKRVSLEERVDKLWEQNDKLRADRDEDRERIARLEDKSRDQGELIDAAAHYVRWIHQGAEPPAPIIGWRWLQYLTLHDKVSGSLHVVKNALSDKSTTSE